MRGFEVLDADGQPWATFYDQGRAASFAADIGGTVREVDRDPASMGVSEDVDPAPESNPAGDIADQVENLEVIGETAAHELLEAGEPEAAAEVAAATLEATADVEEAVADAAEQVHDALEAVEPEAEDTSAEQIVELAEDGAAVVQVDAEVQAAEQDAKVEVVEALETDTEAEDFDPAEQHWLYRDLFAGGRK